MPARLEVLEVQFDMECLISRTGLPDERGTFAVIVCVNRDPPLIDYFLRASAAMLTILGDSPSKQEVAAGIQRFIRLFRALSAPPRATVQGVWAELLLIREGNNPSALARAWHRFADERYDFSATSNRIEVKSSGRRDRRHHFSLEQLEVPPTARLLIASVHAERSSGGLSLGRLIQETNDLLPVELGNRIREVVAETLASAFQSSLDVAFDRELARASTRYCWSGDVPRFERPLPDHISEVKFTADLASVRWVIDADLASTELFAALPPVRI